MVFPKNILGHFWELRDIFSPPKRISCDMTGMLGLLPEGSLVEGNNDILYSSSAASPWLRTLHYVDEVMEVLSRPIVWLRCELSQSFPLFPE